jgi:uncharacterized membrane protein YhaH (DUF805 family)
VVSLLFGFNGRINRAQYWLGVCIGSFGGMMLFFLLGLMTAPAGNFAKETMDPIAAMQLVSSMGVSFGLPLVVMGWIGSALQVKRFHDRGRSGLWILAPMVPAFMIVSSIVGGLMTGSHPEQVLSSVIMWFVLLQVVHLVMFVDLGCMPSKPGPNKYGNPPNGGFTGGGAPISGTPIPGAPSRAATPAPAMGSTLMSAESAIERAIAERAKQAQVSALASQQRAPRPAVTQPGGGAQPATPGSFGRRASR